MLQHVQHPILGIFHDLLTIDGCDLLKVLPNQTGTHVGGHDDNRVLKVDHPTLVVGQPPVVQHLQQDVEHIGMGFLNLIEQHHRVRLAADRLRQLSPLVIAHISRRSTYQARGAELLLVLAHIDAGHHVLIVEEILRQRLGQLGLPHPGGTEEDE